MKESVGFLKEFSEDRGGQVSKHSSSCKRDTIKAFVKNNMGQNLLIKFGFFFYMFRNERKDLPTKITAKLFNEVNSCFNRFISSDTNKNTRIF